MAHSLRKPIALDLFCGSGAVSLGLRQAGFNVVGAVDFDVGACHTYRANHPTVRLLEKDIRDVDPDDFEDLIQGALDLLVVCAPCQPFSSQNQYKRKDDSRRNLVGESKRFIERFNPSLVFLENVPGLASTEIFDEFRGWLKQVGYNVAEPMRVDAADLGVPQRRTRMILVAAKGVSLVNAIDIAYQDKKTVAEAIQDLTVPPVGREAAGADPLHYARKHSVINIERLKHTPIDGGGRDSHPPHLQLTCHINTKNTSFSDSYGRMRWADVAPTLTTGCTDITKGRYAHPVQHRAITLREAARLQSFPDDYVFWGNSSQIATQIGNAVPPAMMKTIALSLKKALES
ncbi:Modification methylase HaeIII [Serratia entomophila]|uniref:DNA cytosine methyltransferase n=1 Tax=Serratia entomophila TaxID=42906 RepID=UPI001F48C56A|nr:DNA cytosine methyltransferase [Serratia entomophila]UIW18799.1 DNA cytosine methyltransferase [Serratia entomophila]CAI0819078.1 Modification methylase HaeIII [Serratia entomophila]CAI0836458.1 Modification methylase HaeIII [Serratia entomophila]CAI0853924.1 Modification methylase HaeIII [Serratia entomophila]CAI0891415.1 Modification methylase HaeIII [Serratia entomophila]